MSTITGEFTKEQLIARADHLLCVGKAFIADHPGYDGMAKDVELFKIALASLEAEAMTQVLSSRAGNDTSTIDKALPEGTMLYTAPPAPIVPDEATPENIEILASTYAPRGITYQWDRDECNAAADSWNACRAAMLQGAGGNSPVIPDGLNIRAVAALREAARNQWLNSDELADKIYWKSMHDIANEIVSAMLAAAPQQEVK